MAETICNGKTRNLPSLEVVKKVKKPIIQIENMNFLLHHYYARQDFDRCKNIIETEFDQFINPEYLFFVKALIEKREGNFFEALKSFQKVIDTNSNNLEAYKEIGKTLYSMGKFKQSMGVFREVEKISSRPDAEIFHYIGELLHRNVIQKEPQPTSHLNDEIKEYFHKAIQYGRKLESYQKLAEIYRHEKEYGKAIEILESSLQIAPDNTEILTEIGVLYLKLNNTQRAFDRFLEINEINDKCPRGLLAFGAILQSRNDLDGALGKYKQITGNGIKSSELWNNIGLCFFKKKKLIVAISCLRKSIWLSPLNYNALYNYCLIMITAQQYASAFQSLAAAINLRKDSGECYMLLGVCLRNLEDYENAFTAFERASTLPDSQKNPLIFLNFALFCYETEKIDLAIKMFNNFVQVSQNFILPTEYKFHATKLKALLQTFEQTDKISTEIPENNLLNDGEQKLNEENSLSEKQLFNDNDVNDNINENGHKDDDNKNNLFPRVGGKYIEKEIVNENEENINAKSNISLTDDKENVTEEINDLV